MAETKTQWEPTGLERFSHLEDKILRVVQAFKSMQEENASLRKENQRLKEEITVRQQSDSAQQESLEQLQKEREELRERVEKALGLLASLETR